MALIYPFVWLMCEKKCLKKLKILCRVFSVSFMRYMMTFDDPQGHDERLWMYVITLLSTHCQGIINGSLHAT